MDASGDSYLSGKSRGLCTVRCAIRKTLRVPLHTAQICKYGQVQYPHCGPGEHIPERFWSSQPVAIPSEEQDAPDAPTKLCAVLEACLH